MAQIYVNSATGSDTAAGSQAAPLKTITKAIAQAPSDTTIQLAPGSYTATTGEVFPLRIPTGVKIVGNETNKGNGILIEGSGIYSSPNSVGNQNVTLQLAGNAELRGVSVTNSTLRGTAVWIEAATPTVANCRLSNSKREGVFITGNANPTITANLFSENLGNGVSLEKEAKGTIRGNTFSKTGYGVNIADNASPVIIENQFSENRSGIVISGEARPKLRKNLSDRNTEDGLTVTGNAIPDLGTNTEAGENTFQSNGQFDLKNSSSLKLIAVGNFINPQRIQGNIELVNNQSPSPSPTPTPNPSPTPSPTPNPSPTPTPTPTPTGNLTDITGHWAANFIQALVDEGIVRGFPDKTFKPDAKMTRAEYAALLTKAFNPTPKRTAITFTDVPSTFWGFQAIQQAYRGEFLSGFPDKSFHPNQNVERVQVIVSLVNGLKLTGGVATDLTAFTDRDVIPSYAKDEVATAIKKHLIVNYPTKNKFNPIRDATRAEVAALVYQALVDSDRLPPIDSPYIV